MIGPSSFTDPPQERRFRHERLEAATLRTRVMTVVAIAALTGMGLVEVQQTIRHTPEYSWLTLWYRLCITAPIWLLFWISPGLPGHLRRADWLHTVGTVIILWAIGLLKWHLAMIFTRTDTTPAVLLDQFAILLITVFIMPFRVWHVVFMLVVGSGGVLAWFAITPPPQLALSGLSSTAGALGGLGMVVVALAWHREAGERRDFIRREEVAALNRELARLNAEKNEFMAAAAHDLRSPLSAVKGLAHELRTGTVTNEARRHRALTAVEDLAQRMLAVVDNYLGAHAIETGTLPVRVETVDLRALIHVAAERHAPAAHGKGQHLLAAPGSSLLARADAALLDQILDNFLSNALKFSPADTTVRLELAVATAAGLVRVEVIDTGPGLSAEEQCRLFRNYARADARATAGEKSHGLGLAVSRRVAEAMGAQVGCDSAPGAGATFWVTLPVA